MRLLYVDRDRAVADGIQSVLETIGHQVVLAHTGPSAVSNAICHGFDILMTGIDLPGLDGLELISLVRAHYPAIPVVILTGSNDVDIDCLPDGPVEVLQKPAKVSSILDALDRVITARA